MILANFWFIPDHPPAQPDAFVIPSYALKGSALADLLARHDLRV
jgi:hypothetical protein